MSEVGRIEILDETENILRTKISHELDEMEITRWKKIEQVEIFITEIKKIRRTIGIVLHGEDIKSLEKAIQGVK